MSSEWKATSLGALTVWMSGGTPKKDEPKYWLGEIPWISASSMHGNRFYDSDLKLTQEGLANGSRLAPRGSVLLLVRGSALHSRIPVGMAMRDVGFNQDVKALLPKTDKLLSSYLLYWLMGMEYNLLNSVVEYTGIGAGKLDTKRMQGLEFVLPPISVQKDIINIIQVLDDRIALLRETNATLEAIAQAIFKSWFVDFDPVRAKMEGRAPEGMDEATAALFPDSFEESELGLVPKGWRVGTLGNVIALRSERTKPSEETKKLPYVPIESISAKVPFLQEYKKGEEAKSSLTLFRQGDILFGAMRPYFHKVCIAPFDGVTRTTVFTLKPTNQKAIGFALFLAFQDVTVEYATQHSEGSTIPYAKWSRSLEHMPFILPPESLQIKFSEIVSAFIARANDNVEQAQTLTNLRDTLLPRLISGKLRLPEAKNTIAEAIA